LGFFLTGLIVFFFSHFVFGPEESSAAPRNRPSPPPKSRPFSDFSLLNPCRSPCTPSTPPFRSPFPSSPLQKTPPPELEFPLSPPGRGLFPPRPLPFCEYVIPFFVVVLLLFFQLTFSPSYRKSSQLFFSRSFFAPFFQTRIPF